MKKTLYKLTFLATIVIVGAGSCKKDTYPAVVAPTKPASANIVEFTAQDASTAYDNFNKYLLDTSRNIYFRASDKSGVGAIWTQAIYWDMAMNAYKKSNKDAKYKKLMDDIYQGNYNWYAKYDWDNGKVWFIYDDIMWWVISLARAYELTNDAKYLNFSESGFKRVWSGSPVVKDHGSYAGDDGGGMYWMWVKDANGNAVIENGKPKIDNGKMSCINYPTVIAAMTLYNTTQKDDYLNKAKEIYTWSRNNLFNTTTGAVADSRHGSSNDWKTHVYNQATCIGAAMMMYNNTKDQKYLDDAVLAADYVKNKMCDANGILPYEGGEEQGVYTAIFAQYIIRLIEDGNKPDYLPWLRKNINTAWANRRTDTNLMGKDYKSNPLATAGISCYDASGIPALMLVVSPANK